MKQLLDKVIENSHFIEKKREQSGLGLKELEKIAAMELNLKGFYQHFHLTIKFVRQIINRYNFFIHPRRYDAIARLFGEILFNARAKDAYCK